jgi:CHASE3 domain sensor protein
MKSRWQRSIFRQFVLLPVALLSLLCIILSYGLRGVERKSFAVDEADLVIAHGNNLIKLMVDEETGLRGYLLTKNPVFLEPFHDADQRLDSEFSAIFGLIGKSPDQIRLMVELKTAHQDWRQDANGDIWSSASKAPSADFLIQRKQKMDKMRVQMDSFLEWAESRRSQTLSHALKSNRVTLFCCIDIAMMIAAFLIWKTQNVLRELVEAHLEWQSDQGQRDKVIL